MVRLEGDETDGMGGLLLPDQRMEKPEPPGITTGIRGFQDRRCLLKTRVVDEIPERGESHRTPPDVRVSVDAGPPGPQAVIQVEASDSPMAKAANCLIQHRLRSGLAGQVVAGGEEVAGVQADADPPGCIDPRENLLQVLESVPKAVSLSGGGFEADPGGESGQPSVHLVERPSHQPEALPRRWVRTRMEDQRADAERLAPEQLLSYRVQAASPNDRILRRKVDEVAPVSDRRHARGACGTSERSSLLGGERGSAPGPAGAGEDLQRACAVLHRATEGERDAARDRLVRAQPHTARFS